MSARATVDRFVDYTRPRARPLRVVLFRSPSSEPKAEHGEPVLQPTRGEAPLGLGSLRHIAPAPPEYPLDTARGPTRGLPDGLARRRPPGRPRAFSALVLRQTPLRARAARMYSRRER